MGDFTIIDQGTSATIFRNGAVLHADGDSCIQCEQCVPLCPSEALFMQDWSISVNGYTNFGSTLAIIKDDCTLGECGQPCIKDCPTEALIAWEPFGSGGDLPSIVPPDYCQLYPDICEFEAEGVKLNHWLKNQCNSLVPKASGALQSEAAQWGMTVEGYVADKLGIIADSGNYVQLGKIAKNAGYFGLAYGTYTAAVAVSDGNLTANELIGIASTALGFIALIPGVGTAVGLGGLAIISAGSLVLGLVANTDLGKSTVIADWDNKGLCN